MYDVVIRSRLVYGMEIINIPKNISNMLNAFQLRGLRKVLNMQSTYITRSNTNVREIQTVNKFQSLHGLPSKNMELCSEYVQNKSQLVLGRIIRASSVDPMRRCTFEKDTSSPTFNINRRVGRPRQPRATETYKQVRTNRCNGSLDVFKSNETPCMKSVAAMARNCFRF